jgi:hypothetical protein
MNLYRFHSHPCGSCSHVSTCISCFICILEAWWTTDKEYHTHGRSFRNGSVLTVPVPVTVDNVNSGRNPGKSNFNDLKFQNRNVKKYIPVSETGTGLCLGKSGIWFWFLKPPFRSYPRCAATNLGCAAIYLGCEGTYFMDETKIMLISAQLILAGAWKKNIRSSSN